MYRHFDTAYTKVFARSENDGRIKSDGDIPRYLTQEDEKILEETFDVFYKKPGVLLCERAYEFYCISLNKTL